MMLKEAFNFYMLIYGNNALKQNTSNSIMACYVNVLLHNTEKQLCAC